MGIEEQLDIEKCKKWRLDPSRNPITNSRIAIGKITYKKIEKRCIELEKEDEKQKQMSSSIDKKLIKKSKDIDKQLDNNEMLEYPDIDDIKFREKLMSIEEINIHKQKKIDNLNSLKDFEDRVKDECPDNNFNKAIFQYFVEQYMSLRTPYRGLMLYYSVGTGKTCAAVSIAESLLKDHKVSSEPDIFVLLPPSLKPNFLNTIMDDSCVGKIYKNFSNVGNIKKTINKRYNILTYGEFVKLNPILDNKTVIIDEAHNLRSNDMDYEGNMSDIDSKAYDVLINRLQNGVNNRLILMTATPMYNEPYEIIDLLNLFLINEGKEPMKKKLSKEKELIMTDELKNKLKYMSERYISYINSNNPFVYAVKLIPDVAVRERNTIFPYGYVMVKLGKEQRNVYKKIRSDDIYLQGFQPANISISVDDVMTKNMKGDKKGLYKYKNIENQVYFPDKKNLGIYGSKILKICESIENSEGIVLIYSRFVKSGILPIALALEHMGYDRYVNGKDDINLLDHKGIKKNGFRYTIMTSSNIDELGNVGSFENILNVVNSKDNINGEKIKIILITKKASEGLSIKNVRQIHILDPWYHISRFEQIIGRGVRRCSHKDLELIKRNVLIYVYIGYMDDMETSDTYSMKIVDKKLRQFKTIEEIVSKNSLDCDLNFNINNYNREIFNNIGKIVLKTSHGKDVDHTFGSDVFDCGFNKSDVIHKMNMREDTMPMFETIRNMIKRIMKTNQYISLDDLKKRCKIYDGDDRYFMYAVQKSIYPNRIMDDKDTILYYGNNGIYKVYNNDSKKVLHLEMNNIDKNEIIVEKDYTVLLNGINKAKNIFTKLYHLYENCNKTNWKGIVKTIIKFKDKYSDLYKIFEENGSIIEYNNNVYYVDIFEKDYNILTLNDYDVSVDDRMNMTKGFQSIDLKGIQTYGSFLVNNNKIQFKFHEKNNKGAVCISKQKEEIMKRAQNGLKINLMENKIDMCIKIAEKYYKDGLLKIAPDYFPKK